MPLKRPCQCDGESAQVGSYLPLAPGISTVRYPIPERIFDYVSTVRSATVGTVPRQRLRPCHNVLAPKLP
jgi:hypothetical protein